MFRTFLVDFNHQKLPFRRLQTLWEWKNRVLLEEYYVFNVVIITCVHYLGPPGPFSFPDSRDLLEALGGPSSAERETPREDPLGPGRIP